MKLSINVVLTDEETGERYITAPEIKTGTCLGCVFGASSDCLVENDINAKICVDNKAIFVKVEESK